MSESETYDVFLQHILDACVECAGFVEGMSFAEFNQDPKTKRAVEWEIEIIGEAAGRIPAVVRAAAPDIPWPRVSGMRNRLAHGYFSINYVIVWNTVHGYLPPLRQAVARLLAGYGG